MAIAFLARSADCIAFAGQALGDQDMQKRGKTLAAMARAAFVRNWMSGNTINCSTQTSHVLALDFDLVPEEHRSAVADRLENLIAARNDHLNTGFLGTPSFLPALAKTGRLKTLAKVLLQRSFPSWLAPIVHGKATTIWERWDSWTPERGFQSTHMNSFNHPVFGCAADWLMTGLVGIASDPQRPGWRHIRLAPCFIPGIDWVRGSVETPLGKVESSWRRQEGKILWTIHLPSGTRATVCLPNQEEELSSGVYSLEVALSE